MTTATLLPPPELDELEALIEEARRHGRRRRRRRAAALLLAALAAAGSYLLITAARGKQVASQAGSQARTPAPAVSPPADAIVFARAASDGLDARSEIAYVPASGGRVVSLTDSWRHGMVAADPTWSANGTRIAFVMSPRGHLNRYAGDGDIYVMNANGRDIRQLTHGLDASAPAWSPDGSRIAFIEGQGGALAAIRADGSDQHVIAHRRGYYESPAWSPDGQRIAYDSGPSWETHAIYTIRPNGTGERQLTPALGPADGGPAWSPAGSRIAYSSKGAIWTISSNGTDAHPVTTCRYPCLYESQPAWSPTGGELVFARELEHRLAKRRGFNSLRLEVVQLSTGKVTALTPKLRWVTTPQWRP